MSDLAELFARDPLRLSQQDLDVIIARYRAARTQFELGAKSAGSSKKLKADTPTVELDLSKLGL